jgi:hypothetical protein
MYSPIGQNAPSVVFLIAEGTGSLPKADLSPLLRKAWKQSTVPEIKIFKA